jgi:LmbE family N-acetylglucosaminyl deacetylase
MRVVAIAPHPDDELIGAGGSLIKHARRGDEVTTIHVVERDRSMLDAGTSAADFAREIVNANAELGVRECVSLDAASRDLTLSRELRLAVVKVLRRVRPAIVYLPHEAEADQEHQLVHHLAMDAIWMAGSQFFGEAGPTPSPPPRLVLGYEVWTPLARFQLTEDIGDVIDAKVRAMRSYTSQLRHADWEAAIRGMAAYRGTVTMGGGFAEVFEVLRVGGGVSAIGDAVRERPAAASVPAPVPDPVTKGAGR